MRNLLLVLILIISSCQQEKTSLNIAKNIEKAQFNLEDAKVQYATLSIDKQCNYLIDVLETSNDDSKQLNLWVTACVKKLCNNKNNLDAATLRILNTQLYDLKFDQAADELATYILNSKKYNQYKEAHGVASATLCYKYVFLRQKDSLNKYITLLDREQKTDTTRWLKRSFYSSKGSLAGLDGNFVDASMNYQKALAFCGKDDKASLVTINLNLAATYLDMDYTEKAYEYSEKVIKLIPIKNLSVQNINTLGIIQSRFKDFKKAENSFNVGIQMAKKSNEVGLLAQSYANYGNLKRKQKQFSEGIRYMKKSDSICKALNIDIGLLINSVNRAELFFDRKEFQLAATELQTKYTMLKKFNAPSLNKEYYELFYKVQDSLGNAILSNQYYRLYKENKDNYLGDFTRSLIVEWELTSEREQQNYEKSVLSLSLEKQTKQKYLIAFIFTLFILVAALFYFNKIKRNMFENLINMREKLALGYELELKNKELLTKSLNDLSIHHTKVEILEEVQVAVEKLPKEKQQLFTPLIQKLKASKANDSLDEFEMRFKGVYEDFYATILQVAPDLTPNELKICAFLRLNMSSKDIATITNRTLGTVENTRLLIRKKLKLDPDLNLQHYLLNL